MTDLSDRWTDKPTGLECAMRQVSYWMCGYVGVPAEHPAHGKDYDDLEQIEAHGGLTYAGDGIVETDPQLWWLGFDTAHSFDGPHTANPTFVRSECERIAKQLAEMTAEVGQ